MKRFISIIVAIAMVATLFTILPFSASADESTEVKPEGTAVKTAEEFAAMTSGIYYLDADITVSVTNATFSGTLNGNGHTITTSVPLFSILGDATVKNLTIAGDLTKTEERNWTAALSMTIASTATVTVENVKNNANVSGDRVGGYFVTANAGAVVDGTYRPTTLRFIGCERNGTSKGTELVSGYVAYMYGDVLEMTDCKNTGNVTSDNYAAGFVARFGLDAEYSSERKAVFTNCVNIGEINGFSYVGGIVAHSRSSYLKFDSCLNEGKIIATGNSVGGIAGNLGAKEKLVIADFVRCVNKGEINMLHIGTGKDTYSAGGMVGYIYGNGENGRGLIDSCINLGTINTGWFGSQFIGYCNSKANVLKNSIAAGSIKAIEFATKTFGCVIGCSSHDVTDCEVKNVFFVENDGTVYYSYALKSSNSANRVTLSDYMSNENTKGNITVVRSDELASGRVAYRLNKAAGETVVYQNLGSDIVPVLDNTHGIVYINQGAYSNVVPDPNDNSTEPVDETSAQPSDSDEPNDTDSGEPSDTDSGTASDEPSNSVTEAPTDKPSDTTNPANNEGGCEGCGGFAAAAQVVALLVGVVGVALVVKRK